jgi:lipopolysaccharide transport system ATP-binding protein
MRPDEVRRKFDEIADFSGVGQFIDAAVKSYSSGMRTRLAFSVAAHLDTEILMVDEVLAVGDLAFQEKCLRKMDQLTKSSDRTVLFVSHSMGAVQSLCNRAVLLEKGRVIEAGATLRVVQAYRDLMLGPQGTIDLRANQGRRGTGTLRIVAMRLEDLAGRPITSVPAGGGVRIILDYENRIVGRPKDVLVVVVAVGAQDTRLFGMPSDVIRADLTRLGPTGSFVCTVPRLPLLPGIYDLIISVLVDRQLTDKLAKVCSISVTESDYFGTGRLHPTQFGEGLVDFQYTLEEALRPSPVRA